MTRHLRGCGEEWHAKHGGDVTTSFAERVRAAGRLCVVHAIPLLLVALALGGLGHSASAQSQRPLRRCLTDTTAVGATIRDTTTVDTVAAGIVYRCIFSSRGPWLVHLVTVDLASRRYDLEAEHAFARSTGRETVSALARRLSAMGDTLLVAINADFFDLASGEVENNQVVRGEWVKGALETDSPHDTFDNAHTQFAVDVSGKPLIGRFALEGRAIARGRAERLVGINYRPPRTPGLVLYTPRLGAVTPSDSPSVAVDRPRDPDAVPAAADTAARRPSEPSPSQLRADSARALSLAATRDAVEVPLALERTEGDTNVYRVTGPPRRGGGTSIPADGAALSATGAARDFLRGVGPGTTIRVLARLDRWDRPVRTVVGGWPGLVRGGVDVAVRADSLEGTFPRFSSARHPRSAIALTRDSATLTLAVVDGRRPWSVGMSLTEWSAMLISLGAWEAMNLDGGGSSTLWVRGEIVNHPSDPQGERAVGNVLLVRKPSG